MFVVWTICLAPEQRKDRDRGEQRVVKEEKRGGEPKQGDRKDIGGGGGAGWRSWPTLSVFMEINHPWDGPRIRNMDISPPPPLTEFFLPSLLISMEQVSTATLQEVRGQVWCRVGWLGIWMWVHLDEWPDIIRYQSYTTSGVKDRGRERWND